MVAVFGPPLSGWQIELLAQPAVWDAAARVYGDGGGLAADPRPGARGRGRDDAGGCTPRKSHLRNFKERLLSVMNCCTSLLVCLGTSSTETKRGRACIDAESAAIDAEPAAGRASW
ncbi:hypothetical protein Abr02nite_60570 [Paractinoplanes brasiliensis]|nr:hypothetical protein Abr02nite_60570 [Actinoplanes brasiliensis]